MNITPNIELLSEPTTVGGSQSPISRGRRENVFLDILFEITKRANANIKRMRTSQWPYVVGGEVTPTLMTMSPSLTPHLVAKVNRAFAKGSTPHVTPQVKLFDPNASSSYVRPYIGFTIPPPLSLFEGRGHDRKVTRSLFIC
ncbi:hypothetical protein NC652_031620 [Populus alba x Populus x berolinensis]|nr:hypothetical protein NC652_031620 [Populus alba x Populus x berolinensis]